MPTNEFRIAKVEKTLRWFEQDIPLLNMRVRELSKERQESARKFAAAMIASGRSWTDYSNNGPTMRTRARLRASLRTEN